MFVALINNSKKKLDELFPIKLKMFESEKQVKCIQNQMCDDKFLLKVGYIINQIFLPYIGI
jgi:hypothetical protein